MGDTVVTKEQCNFCNGTGAYGSAQTGCPYCQGEGSVRFGSMELSIFLPDLITKLDALDVKLDTLDAHLDTIETKIDAL